MAYAGPAGLVLTRDECLVLWALLERCATAENASIREKLKKYLEADDGIRTERDNST